MDRRQLGWMAGGPAAKQRAKQTATRLLKRKNMARQLSAREVGRVASTRRNEAHPMPQWALFFFLFYGTIAISGGMEA